MFQITKAVLLALVLVSGVSFAEGRIDSIYKSEKRPVGTFVLPNPEKGVAEIFELTEITPEMEAAKAGDLSEEEIQDLIKRARKTIATEENKIGDMPLAKAGKRFLTSTPACGWWGWRRGWGGCGWGGGWGAGGWGGGCGGWGGGWGSCGTFVNVGVTYGFAFGGNCGFQNNCGFFW